MPPCCRSPLCARSFSMALRAVSPQVIWRTKSSKFIWARESALWWSIGRYSDVDHRITEILAQKFVLWQNILMKICTKNIVFFSCWFILSRTSLRAVFATRSQATRRSHLGFSLNIPGSSTATVTGLQAGASYRYALYQYSSDARWVGHKSFLSINGGSIFSTSITSGSDPSATGTFVAKSDGTTEFLFTRVGEHQHTVFSGLSVTKICAGLKDMLNVNHALVYLLVFAYQRVHYSREFMHNIPKTTLSTTHKRHLQDLKKAISTIGFEEETFLRVRVRFTEEYSLQCCLDFPVTICLPS